MLRDSATLELLQQSFGFLISKVIYYYALCEVCGILVGNIRTNKQTKGEEACMYLSSEVYSLRPEREYALRKRSTHTYVATAAYGQRPPHGDGWLA